MVEIFVMEERLNKLESQNKIITGLLAAVLALMVVFMIFIAVFAAKAVPVVKEYKPVVDKLASIDVDAMVKGIEACKKLAEADINMENIGESLEQLDNIQKMMGDFKEALPKLEVLADAVSSISDKLDGLFKFFGR